MVFDVLIIGGGVAGMQCALVIGSGLKKPFAIDKKVGIIMHQKSSHLQNALFNNVLGLPSGTLGADVLTQGKKQLAENYSDISQIEHEKVISVSEHTGFYNIKTKQPFCLSKTRDQLIEEKYSIHTFYQYHYA